MRADEKVDPELEQEAELDQVEALEEEQDVEHDREEDVDTSSMHFHELVAYIEGALRGDDTGLADLDWLSDIERQGLELVTAAIDGRTASSVKQIFAEDRVRMLNEALAALQPALAAGFESAALESRELYQTLVDDMATLKHSLESLSDAQEEIFVRDEMKAARTADDGKPGKPKPKPPDAGEVGDVRPSQLAGPGPAVEKPVVPTTLVGPGVAPDKPVVPTTLTGPGPAVDKPVVPTTLVGPGVAPDKKPQPSTAWDGDEPPRR